AVSVITRTRQIGAVGRIPPAACKYKDSVCRYCEKKGHLEKACLKKKKDGKAELSSIYTCQRTSSIVIPSELQHTLNWKGQPITFEVDTGYGDSFIGKQQWTKLGEPPLRPLNVEVPWLNLLGREAIQKLKLSVDNFLQQSVNTVFEQLSGDKGLQEECKRICDQFPDIFKPEFGILKDIKLEVQFKEHAQPVFCKPRTVLFAIQQDLYFSFICIYEVMLFTLKYSFVRRRFRHYSNTSIVDYVAQHAARIYLIYN
ncbi:hypothetical protein CAPTEDRAFT_187986, partial [Capitella teleta]